MFKIVPMQKSKFKEANELNIMPYRCVKEKGQFIKISWKD